MSKNKVKLIFAIDEALTDFIMCHRKELDVEYERIRKAVEVLKYYRDIEYHGNNFIGFDPSRPARDDLKELGEDGPDVE